MKLPTLPGLEIALSVNREDLQEYDEADADDTENGAVRFVEAVSGANFTVEFRTDIRFAYRNDDLELRISLDGVHAEALVFYAPKLGVTKTVTGRMEFRNGQAFNRRFTFAELNTSKDITVSV